MRAYLSQYFGAGLKSSMRPSNRNSHRFVAARDEKALRPFLRVLAT
ncbi:MULTISPECIES: hypothetical protein [unclassified Bradyrhizobium]